MPALTVTGRWCRVEGRWTSRGRCLDLRKAFAGKGIVEFRGCQWRVTWFETFNGPELRFVAMLEGVE